MASDASLVMRATLRDDLTRQLGQLAATVKAFQKSMQEGEGTGVGSRRDSESRQREIFKIDNAFRSVARRMISRVLLIGTAIGAAMGHAVAFTAALWPMIGALAAVPAVTVSFAVGIGALITGFRGLGEAMKKTGGGAGNTAQQIAAAERRVEMAQRSARDAQEALNDAREEAADRLRDLSVSYARSQLDVKEAALAVKEAEKALREARLSGDRDQIKRAELALASARLSQIEATNRATDVAQDYAKAEADAGKIVRDATERQADALYELAEAQKALQDAGRGGGGGAEAYNKLTASAKALVDTLKALGVQWGAVRRATQERVFAGVAQDVRLLSERYLPVMLTQLPEVGQGWNNLIRSLLQTASMPGFVDDTNTSLGHMGTMWQRVGSAFGPFLSGFRHWVSIGSEFLPRLGAWVERAATRFDMWSRRMRETGQGFRWIEGALKSGQQFNDLMGAWASVLGKVFSLGRDDTLVPRLIEGSRAFREWLDTAEGTERISRMWDRLRELGSALWVMAKNLMSALAQADISGLTSAFNTLAVMVGLLADSMSVLNPVLKVVIPLFITAKVAAIAAKLAIAPLVLTFAALKAAVSLLHVPLSRFGAETGAAAAKSAAAGLAMAALSGASLAAGIALMGSGSVVEGLALVGLGAVGLVRNVKETLLPAMKALIARFGALKVAMGATVLGAAIAGGIMLFQTFRNSVRDTEEQIGDMQRSFEVFARSGAMTGEMAREFGTGADAVANFASKVRVAQDVTDNAFNSWISRQSWLPVNDAVRDLQKLDETLVRMVESGMSSAEAMEHLKNAYGEANVEYAIANGLLPEFARVAGDAVDAERALGDTAAVTADEWARAARNADDYYTLLRSQTDPLLRHAQAQERVRQAQQRYNDVLGDSKSTADDVQGALNDLTAAELALNDAQTELAKVNGPLLLEQLRKQAEAGEISWESFHNLEQMILALPEAMQKVPASVDVEAKLVVKGLTQSQMARDFVRAVEEEIRKGARRAGGGGAQALGPTPPADILAPTGASVAGFGPGTVAGFGAGASSGGETVFRFDLNGPTEVKAMMKTLIRNIVRVDGRGDVQVAFG